MDKELKELIEFFEEAGYRVSILDENEVELETWTQGGVNMIHYLNPFNVEEFKTIVDCFDVEDEINAHRQDERYRAAFTLKQSFQDFEAYHNRLKKTLRLLEEK